LRRRSEVGGNETNSLSYRLETLARDGEHLGRHIEQRQARLGESLGDHLGDDAGAGAEVEHLEAIIELKRNQIDRRSIEIIEAGHQFAARAIVVVGARRECFSNRLGHARQPSEFLCDEPDRQ